MPGDTRYTPIFFAANSSRTIIWLCNDLPDWIDKPAVQARFNVLELPADYAWKAVKGSGAEGDPIVLDEDEEMPQVKREEPEPELQQEFDSPPKVVRLGRVRVQRGEPVRKRQRREDYGEPCEACMGQDAPCMAHA